jgi:hypothetical protein
MAQLACECFPIDISLLIQYSTGLFNLNPAAVALSGR